MNRATASTLPATGDSLHLKGASYSDVALAFAVVAIIGLMIWPLPLMLIDSLVAVNIIIGVTLLLIAIYIPTPVAFPSFPSVLLLTTLFRLALSIAVTRQILLNADAGHIIDTFGNMVVGGNIVVGLVVFLIITVVQFIVIAKGAERVAEVAARFTLDAMPGKQLSIDSDLRSGLMGKDEARRRRRHLEIESQLHGSLDGAMKFVKGDAIAGIIIIIVNLLGGLAIGIMQFEMSLGDAVRTYSILTIGDGLVAQIPALLSALSAGLVVTRTASDEQEKHLGHAISRQLTKEPRVLMVAGIVALVLIFVPGFPKLIFLMLGLTLLGFAAWQVRDQIDVLRKLFPVAAGSAAANVDDNEQLVELPDALVFEFGPGVSEKISIEELQGTLISTVRQIREEFGVPIPVPVFLPQQEIGDSGYRLRIFGIPAVTGQLEVQESNSEAPRQFEAIRSRCAMALKHQLSEFIGIQEVANLYQQLNEGYPELVKETLRAVAPQRITEILKRLVGEMIPIRNLRCVFEAIADIGGREKDILLLTEHVRVALRRETSDRYADSDRMLNALLVHPELEERLRQSVHVTSAGSQLAVEPELTERVISAIRLCLEQQMDRLPVLLCSLDVRCHLRKLIEVEFFELPVMSFQELAPDLRVIRMGQVNA